MTFVTIPPHIKDNLEEWMFKNQLPVTVSCLRSRLTEIYHSNDDATLLLQSCHNLWSSKLKAWYLVHSPNTHFVTKTQDGSVYSSTSHGENSSLDTSTIPTWKLVSENQLSQTPVCSCCSNPTILYCLYPDAVSTPPLSKTLTRIPCDIISIDATQVHSPGIVEKLPTSQQLDDSILKAFEDEQEMESKPRRSRPLLQDISEHIDMFDVDMESSPIKNEYIHSNEKTLDGSFVADNPTMIINQRKRKQIKVPIQTMVNGYLVTEMVLQEVSDIEEEKSISKENHNIQSSSNKKPQTQKQGSLLKFFKKE